jgi:hypothetical protein
MQPAIMGTVSRGDGAMRLINEKGAPSGRVESRDKSIASNCLTFVTTSFGLMTRRSVASPMMTYVSVGRKEDYDPS